MLLKLVLAFAAGMLLAFSLPPFDIEWLGWVALAPLLGAVAAMAAASRRRWHGLRWVLFVAGAGVAAEWLTAFSPLPLNLALCQYRTLHVIQVASLTGIWGVSFLVWWTNAALADAVLRPMPASPGLK